MVAFSQKSRVWAKSAVSMAEPNAAAYDELERDEPSSPTLVPDEPSTPVSSRPRKKSSGREEEEEDAERPWLQMIFSVLFVASMYAFQDQHFDIAVQQDVHAGLRDNLALRIDRDDFDRVRSRSDMFGWLIASLLPALSNDGAAFTPGVSAATRNRTQCLAALGPAEEWAERAGEWTDRAEECAHCGAGLNTTSKLETYIDEYTLLFEGLRIRQTLHCELASINAKGHLHRLQHHSASRLFRSCELNAMFAETDDDVDYYRPSNRPREEVPPAGCYEFGVESVAAGTGSAEERKWLRKSKYTRREIFLPLRAGQAAPLAAAQALLNATSNSEWADPATAIVDASFMVMSLE